MTTRIDGYLSEIVKAYQNLNIPKFRLAGKANLHPNTLTQIGSPTWAPSITTLRSLERVLLPPLPPTVAQPNVDQANDSQICERADQ